MCLHGSFFLSRVSSRLDNIRGGGGEDRGYLVLIINVSNWAACYAVKSVTFSCRNSYLYHS
jgi:hypothetical protein